MPCATEEGKTLCSPCQSDLGGNSFLNPDLMTGLFLSRRSRPNSNILAHQCMPYTVPTLILAKAHCFREGKGRNQPRTP